MPQCEGLTQSGQRCSNQALHGSRFCHLQSHASRPVSRADRVAEWLQSHLVFVIITAFFLAAALIGLIIGPYSLWRQIVSDRENATSGILSASALTTAKYLSFGGIRFEDENREGIVIKDADEPILTVHMRRSRSASCLWLWQCKSQLLVSWKSRNAKGDLIAEVKDNEWSHQARPAIYDRNYTDDILEIREATSGRVWLQLVNLGDTIYVAGTFICSHTGWTYTLGTDKGHAVELRPPGSPISTVISPICEYPSARHLGQCSIQSVERRVQPQDQPLKVWTALQACRDLAVEENKRAQQQP